MSTHPLHPKTVASPSPTSPTTTDGQRINGCEVKPSVYPFSIRCRFNAREGSGVFSTAKVTEQAQRELLAGFNAREGSGVFSTRDLAYYDDAS